MIDVNNVTLTLVRHPQSEENANKYKGFYSNPRIEGPVRAHERSKAVDLTTKGLSQAAWIGLMLGEIPNSVIYTSTYTRTKKAGEIAFPGRLLHETSLLDEQHYGDVTYMTKEELFKRYPETKYARQNRKHLWVPPGEGGESAENMRTMRAVPFVAEVRAILDRGNSVIAIAHHTSIMALRSVIENRPLEDVVAETSQRKIPNAGGKHYEYDDRGFTLTSSFEPPEEWKDNNG